MSTERTPKPLFSDKIREASSIYHERDNAELFGELLVCASEEDLSEEQIAYCTIFLLREAEEDSGVGNYYKILEVYKLALEALIETGNLHTETYQQFFQQYNNFIALSLNPR